VRQGEEVRFSIDSPLGAISCQRVPGLAKNLREMTLLLRVRDRGRTGKGFDLLIAPSSAAFKFPHVTALKASRYAG
jgi:hypothetical protein